MELALVLPILLVVLLGLIEFGLLLYARSNVVTVSRDAARWAALGEPHEEIESRVRDQLGRLGRRARVEIERGDDAGEPVHLAVHVPMSDAAPDLLWMIGYSLEDRWLTAETHMCRE